MPHFIKQEKVGQHKKEVGPTVGNWSTTRLASLSEPATTLFESESRTK